MTEMLTRPPEVESTPIRRDSEWPSQEALDGARIQFALRVADNADQARQRRISAAESLGLPMGPDGEPPAASEIAAKQAAIAYADDIRTIKAAWVEGNPDAERVPEPTEADVTRHRIKRAQESLAKSAMGDGSRVIEA